MKREKFDDETVETRKGFELHRKGDKYFVVSQAGQRVSPEVSEAEARNLLANLTRSY